MTLVSSLYSQSVAHHGACSEGVPLLELAAVGGGCSFGELFQHGHSTLMAYPFVAEGAKEVVQ